MTTSVSDYISVRERLEKFGRPKLTGLVLLPANFDTADSIAELRQHAEAATVKTLFRSADIPYSDVFPPEGRAPYIQNNSLEWVAPTLFISASLVIENPTLVTMSLNVVSEYVAKLLRGVSGEKRVSLDVVIEQANGSTCKRISYKGPVDGLSSVGDVVRTIAND